MNNLVNEHSEPEPAPTQNYDQTDELLPVTSSKEPLKRKDCITNLDYEMDTEVVNFRSSPEYSQYSWRIFPDDKLKTAWDLFIMILVLYTLTVYVFRMSFSDTDPFAWAIFEYLLDFVFFLDCIFTFFTCFYGTNSELVVSHSKIAIRYLKFWFWIDILGFFPYEAFTNSSAGDSDLFSSELKPLFRALRILKLTRLFKWWSNPFKTQELKEFLQICNIKLTRVKLLILAFVLFCHVMCCFWCILPRATVQYDNWQRFYKIEDTETFEKYLAGIYWIITTICTIGFGDIVPQNDLEISVTICVMSAGVFFYSYTISSMTSLIAASNFQNSRIEEYTNVLQGIATEYKLSKSFHKRLNEALVYNLKEKRMDFSTLLNSLPPKMASKLKYRMNHKLLENNDFFKDKPSHFTQRILEFLMPYKVETNEFIYKEGSPCDEIYFLLSGEVVFVYDTNIIYESVVAGGYFGDAELFLCEERETTVKSTKRTKMLTLDRENLLNILKDYEKLKVDMIIMSMIKRKQLKKTSIMSGSLESSQDIHISPLQFSFPENGTPSEDISVKFIIDCSSSLEPKNEWE